MRFLDGCKDNSLARKQNSGRNRVLSESKHKFERLEAHLSEDAESSISNLIMNSDSDRKIDEES